MEQSFLILDKEERRHTVVFSDKGWSFPSFEGRFSQELHQLVEAEEDPIQGPLAVVVIVEGLTRQAWVLGPDWVEIWTAMGYGEAVQQSLRLSHRSLRGIYDQLTKEGKEKALEIFAELRAKMDEASLVMIDWEDAHA